MKLIIQIPCYNEEETLPITLADLPREIEGIDSIEVLVINDGSQDHTSEVARELGVDYIVTHPVNKGLAAAFRSGLAASLQIGADIIVNTDADNQYPGRYIEELVKPILQGQAEMVIGDRQTDRIAHFSPIKRLLQRFGSSVVRFVSQSNVPDAPSGFRAFSRTAAMRLNTFTRYTYTLETIIQASNHNLLIKSIPISTNDKLRESRLIKSMSNYVLRSASTILQLFLLYQPMRFFAYLSAPFFTVGAILWIRFGIILLMGESERGANIQSITVGGILLVVAFLLILIGSLGQLIAFNRRLQEEILFQLKQQNHPNIPLMQIEKNPRNQAKEQLHENP